MYQTSPSFLKVSTIFVGMWFVPQVSMGTQCSAAAVMMEPDTSTALEVEVLVSASMTIRYPHVSPQLSCIRYFWSALQQPL